MRMITLQSGSNGNAVYVEAAGVRLLIDAGISGSQMQTRLACHGIRATDIDALLISHDHSDHIRAMGIYHRKYRIPVYVTERTLLAARRRVRLGMLNDVNLFTSGSTFQVGDARIETVRTAHDSADGVGFVIHDGDRRLGVLTDLGHVFDGLPDVLHSLDAVLLESNYDPQMLSCGPYPEHLKVRIRGPGGHLSNDEAADLLCQAFRHRLQWACLAHLSEQNNEPDVALRTHRAKVDGQYPIHVASRCEVSAAFQVSCGTPGAGTAQLVDRDR
jgi:phosphoribosyl 1,2-cyclic phosphodiesterase